MNRWSDRMETRRRLAALGVTLALTAGLAAGCSDSPSPSPSASPSPSPSPSATSAKPTQPPAPKPPATTSCKATGYQGPEAADPAAAVANAHAASSGASCVSRLAIAVYDRQAGTWYTAGDVDQSFATASLVKVFIAARLLIEGKADDQATRDLMFKMITCSDDNAANTLYYKAGGEAQKDAQGNVIGPGLAAWTAQHYGIAVGVTPRPGWWGLTTVTARAMATFYAKAMAEPVVWDWLGGAMASTTAKACDGFNQSFGLYSAAQDRGVKQGWMVVDGITRMHSTGFIDGRRYTVALLMQGSSALYGAAGSTILTAVATALLPGGHLPSVL
jgi:hypothetical protein